MTLPRGVRYSILRDNIEVPLIPVDQLPFYIQGLPRELTPFQSYTEGWKSIGETQQPALPLSIRAPSGLQSSRVVSCMSRNFLPPDHDARNDGITTSRVSQPLAGSSPISAIPSEMVLDPPVSKSQLERPAVTTANRYVAPQSEGTSYPTSHYLYPSGIEPHPWKKEFCTHWIRTNSCDFMQQGCKYKHEMPGREKLRELGFAEIPKWYRDKTAISAGASSWFRPRPAQDDKVRRLSIESPASCAFRPSKFAARSQTHAMKLSDSVASKADQDNSETPNLIDLDDSSIGRVSLTPSLCISPAPCALPFDEISIVTQPAKQITKTVASLLKQAEPAEEQCADVSVCAEELAAVQSLNRQRSRNAASWDLGNDTDESIMQTPSQSEMFHGVDDRKSRKENSITIEQIGQEHSTCKHPVEPEPNAKSSSNSSISQQKRSPRMRKPTHPATLASRKGLASSQYATGKTPREACPPSKGFKRSSARDGVTEQRSEIVRRQCAVHVKEQFRKGASSKEICPGVATGEIETARITQSRIECSR